MVGTFPPPLLHEYVYGEVPPAGVRSIAPLLPGSQDVSVIETVAVIGSGSVNMVTGNSGTITDVLLNSPDSLKSTL